MNNLCSILCGMCRNDDPTVMPKERNENRSKVAKINIKVKTDSKINEETKINRNSVNSSDEGTGINRDRVRHSTATTITASTEEGTVSP